jgi:phosphomannomutase
MGNKELIFTISGIRGIIGETLTPEIARNIALAYGLWLKNDDKIVIVGRDTRPSGSDLEKAMVEGLTYANCKIINLGICPTPLIIYAKNKLNVPGGIIITGSHNPPEWNGIKLLSSKTFLNNSEINEILNILNGNTFYQHFQNRPSESVLLKKINPVAIYIQAIKNVINFKKIKRQNKLKVALDTGAGAGNLVTPIILKQLGCDIELINSQFINNKFPREIEPIEKNLTLLKRFVIGEGCDVGFAQDCDADRIAIIGDDGTCYSEDIGLALIADFTFRKYTQENIKPIFVTNSASSLMFDIIAEKYNAQVVRTPVGERFLAEKMEKLIKKKGSTFIIFGGEGSCGGVMMPQFNNTRDGIFATAKIIEILTENREKISVLVSKLPKFYAFRKYIGIENENLEKILSQLKNNLISNGEDVKIFDKDLRFGQENEWFVLIHPSNTEPIIRIISEARNKDFALRNLNLYSKKLRNLIL